MAAVNEYHRSLRGGGRAPGEQLAPFLDLIPHDRLDHMIADASPVLIQRAIACGPAPPALLARLARQTRFPGLPIVEAAAGMAGGAGLFDPPQESFYSDEAPPVRDASGARSGGGSLEELLEEVDAALLALQDRLGERREGQADMAREVMTALAQGEISVIEAGTGTGKSLAYLLPAAVFAAATGERVVVSTHTRHLQQQLLERELPDLMRIIRLDLPVARLMGRENYICSRRLVSSITRISADDPMAALLLGLAASLATEGTAESIPSAAMPFPSSRISAPSRCMMKGCPQADLCPLLSARKRGSEAAILLVNHALLMTDHAQGGAVIGPYGHVIFDEAHHLERCVTENLSIRISEKSLERIFEGIEPISPSSEWWKRFAIELERPANGQEWASTIDLLARKKSALEMAYAGIFDAVAQGGYSETGCMRYGADSFKSSSEAFDGFYICIMEFERILDLFYEASASQSAVVLQRELAMIGDELSGLAESVRYLQEADDPDGVFWLESGRGGRISAICGSPLEIDRRFADFLDERIMSAVFTSATLSGEGNFDYFEKRLGLRLSGREPVGLIAGSPFDFESNLLVLRTVDVLDPNDESFAERVAEMISSLSTATGRRIMSLFTSYRMCLATASFLEGMELDGRLLVQGSGVSREELSSLFRESPGAVLLGVASFWEGVDFPGGELEILVIPKLPFPVPTEPVIQARSERMEMDGANPFTGLFLPEAILKLRQGVGRLIRRKDDRGVVVLMDPRLGSRSYAGAVLSSLPVGSRLVSSSGEAAAAASAWLK